MAEHEVEEVQPESTDCRGCEHSVHSGRICRIHACGCKGPRPYLIDTETAHDVQIFGSHRGWLYRCVGCWYQGPVPPSGACPGSPHAGEPGTLPGTRTDA